MLHNQLYLPLGLDQEFEAILHLEGLRILLGLQFYHPNEGARISKFQTLPLHVPDEPKP